MKRAVLLSLMLFSPLAAAESYRKPLISVDRNLREKPQVIQSKDVTPQSKAWSVELRRLHGGKQEGVDLVIVDNGVVRITLIPTRGMGIQEARRGDLVLGWRSPVKEIVHPQLVNLQARGGLGWLDGFTEMMCRCGLENNGQPGTDEFITNTGDKSTMELTLHGKIANQPAQEVELIVETEAPYRITLRGVVHERMLFGPKLELATELTTTPGADSFTVTDVVTNRGATPQEFEMLYHINLGQPLLGKDATFLAPLEKVVPFNANAARDLATWNRYLGPTAGYVEQVYLLTPRADVSGKTLAMLRSPDGARAASVRFSTKELPYLTLWKNTGAEADGYVTGIEPGTNYPNKRIVERKAGRVPKLDGGASHRMSLVFGLHSGAVEADAIVREIEGLQGERPPTLVAPK
jgi:hypothetical protein